jgi:hypothetical protein
MVQGDEAKALRKKLEDKYDIVVKALRKEGKALRKEIEDTDDNLFCEFSTW